MRYKIGQVLYPGWVDMEDFDEDWHKCEIVCIALFGDFTWKYGIKDNDSEYGNQIEFVGEDEIEKEYCQITKARTKDDGGEE